MAYRIENDGSIVVDGFEKGIADSPYSGISDLRNVNIVSVPGEASVNFATAKTSAPAVLNATIASADAATELLTLGGGATNASLGLDSGMAITFSASTVGGVSTSTTYWILLGPASNNFYLYSDYPQGSIVNVTSTGTGTFSTVNVATPKFFAKADTGYFMLDSKGQVWSNYLVTGTNSYWRYTGNRVPNSSYTSGNGMVYYQATGTPSAAGNGYLFIFHSGSVDYTATGTISWVYQWNPSNGTAAGYSSTPSSVLNSTAQGGPTHAALVGQDNVAYYCDSNFIGAFFEKPGQFFDPSNIATYTPEKQALALPPIETAQCLAELGVSLLVGGIRNQIYPWDRVSTSFRYPILIAEYSIQRMVTVNTNTYIFAGGRGRIYVTNGSQANLYKKVPDHISGTVEPYFAWGDAVGNKNQLYFSFSATTNGGTPLTAYGGVWAIDLDTKALRLTNKLSYGTYAGLATALTPNFIVNPAGAGLFIGWDSGASAYGIDQTVSVPYAGSQASVDSDLIPIGTFLKRKNFQFVEYKLNQPLAAGESVTVNYRTRFSDSYSLSFSDSTPGNLSNFKQASFANVQWIQLQAVLNSTASNPTYARLKELRIR